MQHQQLSKAGNTVLLHLCSCVGYIEEEEEEEYAALMS
jgi:hypothetical protein